MRYRVATFNDLAFIAPRTVSGAAPTPPFDPNSVPNLVAWFDAAVNIYDARTGGNAVTTDGTMVKRWVDRKGNQPISAELNANVGPVYKTNIVNSFPVLRFNGVSSLQSLTSLGHFVQPFTLFIACQLKSQSGYNVIVEGVSSGRFIFGVYPSLTWDLWVNSGSDISLGASNFNFNIFFCMVNGASSKFAFNTKTQSAVVGNPGTNPVDFLTLGTGFAGSNGAEVDIAEFLIYSGDVATPDDNSIIDYLINKYTMVPGGGPYVLTDLSQIITTEAGNRIIYG